MPAHIQEIWDLAKLSVPIRQHSLVIWSIMTPTLESQPGPGSQVQAASQLPNGKVCGSRKIEAVTELREADCTM